LHALHSQRGRAKAGSRQALPFAKDGQSYLSCAMSLTRSEVEKIALLSRLSLSEDEVERMTTQLGAILGYMDLLGEVDTTGVEPMAHARDLTNVFRDDAVQPSLEREQALANAPHRDDECYLVPAVL
jgi:aspartyl-tRNA(Asn)/glutamyl-tRNA(Gln) amidotransferase subunit C